jgi:hypothetical protein
MYRQRLRRDISGGLANSAWDEPSWLQTQLGPVPCIFLYQTNYPEVSNKVTCPSNFYQIVVTTRRCQNCPAGQSLSGTIQGCERGFAPRESGRRTAPDGRSWSVQREKRPLDASDLGSRHCHAVFTMIAGELFCRPSLSPPSTALKIASNSKLLSVRPSPELREPENLHTFVSSPLDVCD